MKIAEIRNKSAEELKGLVLDLKKEQFNLRFQASAGEQTNKGRVKEVRRTIARIKTVMGGGDNAAAVKAAPAKAKKASTAKKKKD